MQLCRPLIANRFSEETPSKIEYILIKTSCALLYLPQFLTSRSPLPSIQASFLHELSTNAFTLSLFNTIGNGKLFSKKRSRELLQCLGKCLQCLSLPSLARLEDKRSNLHVSPSLLVPLRGQGKHQELFRRSWRKVY